MMFLMRSTFWFGLVVSNMPLHHVETPPLGDPLQSTAIVSISRAVGAACAQEGASCRAVLGAVASGLAASEEARRQAARAEPSARARRPSVNTLTAQDMAPPWRGPQPRAGG
jgi:hypothetical protein